MPEQPAPSSADLDPYIRQQIENLRPRLLDLSRVNPLVSIRFSPRSTSQVRVVDELPDALCFDLTRGKAMRFAALPPLDEDPKDEREPAFQEALASALLTDETYQEEMARIESPNQWVSDDDAAEDAKLLQAGRVAERALKDRVRQRLGMPPRQTKEDLSLPQHARINGISPSYDLPKPEEEHPDGRHGDNEIQTLLLPDDLDRKLNGLTGKCRTWMQETGINVLHAAFGFLEYEESGQDTDLLAPLILLPVGIDKKRTNQGPEYWVSTSEETGELNQVLVEKLRRVHGIELPAFDGGSVEGYFARINDIRPKALRWRVRRQVAFGVFPSARIAMYHDLATHHWSLAGASPAAALFQGETAGTASPFAPVYRVDEPTVEQHVTHLVLDADSSQFSAMVDAARGRNLAIEGPPGTGKSQTIVNMIANTLAAGKKVLFVAEKLAALDVVKSRLEAVHLGEFLLPLQAERSSRQEVIQSLRDRLGMALGERPRDYEQSIDRFRDVREKLAGYIDLIQRTYAGTGWTVHQVLGRAIRTGPFLESRSSQFQFPAVPDIETYDRAKLDDLRRRGEAVTAAWRALEGTSPVWQGIGVAVDGRWQAQTLCRAAAAAAGEHDAAAAAWTRLARFAVGDDFTPDRLAGLNRALDVLPDPSAGNPASLADAVYVGRLCRDGRLHALKDFLAACQQVQQLRQDLSRQFAAPLVDGTVATLREAGDLGARYGLASLDLAEIQAALQRSQAQRGALREAERQMGHFIQALPDGARVPLDRLKAAFALWSGASAATQAQRNAITADPRAAQVIRQAAAEALALRDRRTALSAAVATSFPQPVAELRAHAATLREAGLFRAFSGSYKAAKHFYLGLMQRAQFDRMTAADDLLALAQWQQDADRFMAEAPYQSVFGLSFRGIDTDFAMFEGLLDFYVAVDRDLADPVCAPLRRFLKEAPMDQVRLLPDLQALPAADCAGTIDHLVATADKLDDWLAEFARDRTRLEELIARLGCSAPLPTAVVPDLAGKLETYLDRTRTLDVEPAMRDLLGERFAGAATTASAFQRAIATAEDLADEGECATVLRLLDEGLFADSRQAVQTALQAHQRAEAAVAELCEQAAMARPSVLAGTDHAAAAAHLHRAGEDVDGLLAHAAYHRMRGALSERGLDWVAQALLDGGEPLDDLANVLDAAVARAMAVAVYATHGRDLQHYAGRTLDGLRTSLARLDRAIIEMSRRHLRQKLFGAAQPRPGNGRGPKAEWTEMALVNNEVNKKRMHISPRDLIARAARSLQELKPCWMMSPLAVAQYVPKDGLTFDLCIIDEASQMPPEAALGALLRCRQVVVVGDTNQLPPTSFFRAMIDNDDDEAKEDEVLPDSVLAMANARFQPRRRLHWHYRSRDPRLINYSNHQIYDGSLTVFPAPTPDDPRQGVSLHPVQGLYKSSVNVDEATAMVDAICRFMRETPDRSLGVVTLNQKQRDLLTDLLERAFSDDKAAQAYVDRWKEADSGLQDFFVKNLENVQGDERDVIFIGTVYGPETAGGPVAQRFGPINGPAGRRRLNVLFSRAKRKIVTFSSMTSADIVPEPAGTGGRSMLKGWLDYCATGRLPNAGAAKGTPDSDFERHVIDEIRALGLEADAQVGAAGYFVDIGVKHPQWPPGYLMAVECDGPTYHSSPSARDRDRLRQQVLEGLGWYVHRIWSTDWFQDAVGEMNRLRAVIDARLADLQAEAEKHRGSLPAAAPAAAPTQAVEAPAVPTPPLGAEEAEEPTEALVPAAAADDIPVVAVGDRVMLRFLDGDRRSLEVIIDAHRKDPERGRIWVQDPLAESLLEAEEGDEIKLMVDNRLRLAAVERIDKGAGNGLA
ncbi:MAG: DUF4011 domain-containing protein [Rhodospirillaceae bacterium]|nr:DUF4011 domain-containing protein [Rhodospirillaceae bacterium]